MLLRTMGIVVTVAVLFAPQQPSGRAAQCGHHEAAALRAAHGAAQRASKDRLLVKWAHGTHVFVDSGYHEGDMDGVRYEYCAPVLGYQLIAKADEGLFTGVLVDTATGRILPGGTRVEFAPDTSRYFAVQQPDGLDGEEWLLYSRAGGRLWKGVSGIEAKSHQGDWTYFIAVLDQPHFNPHGVLRARLRCSADTTRSTTVTLQRSGVRFAWLPTMACAGD
jgi:hypothetical protein